MLKQLIVRNYQSWKFLKIKFSPNITVIHGVSTTGKTAILRALNSLLRNRPSGDSYRSNFTTDDVYINLTLDKWDIIKQKGEDSFYGLANKKGETETWEKFGTKVPDKIVDVLNISELNIQDQLDPPFLITSSAGEITKVINRITKADKADEAITSLTRKVNQTNNQIINIDLEVSNLKENIEKYKPLPKIRKMINRHNTLDEKVEDIEYDIEKLEEFVDIHEEYKKTKGVVGKCNKILKLMDKIKSIDQEWQSEDDYLSELETYLYLKHNHKAIVQDYEEYVEKYLDRLQEAMECPVCGQEIRGNVIREIREEL